MFVASSVLITQSPHFALRATNNDAKPPLLAADYEVSTVPATHNFTRDHKESLLLPYEYFLRVSIRTLLQIISEDGLTLSCS